MAMNEIRKFTFWCQKVLPLVYDDSLSYYEVLCKVVHKLNEVIKNIDEIPDYINQYIDERLSDEHIQELIRQAINYLEDAISKDNEGDNTNFSKDYKAGDLLWWNDKFYRIVRDVNAGDSILDGGTNPNIEEVSFAEMFNEFINYLKALFTENDEGGNTNASRDFVIGEFVWINNKLYEVSKAISEGNSFIYEGDNQNVVETNIDILIHDLRTIIANNYLAIVTMIGYLDDLTTSDKTSIVNAINSLVSNIGDLDDLTTTDKSSIVNAINEVNETGGGALTLIGDMDDLRPPYNSTLVEALNARLPVVSVKDFGAVGDGVTDDANAFNQWLSYVGDNGYIGFIPNGTYYISYTTVTYRNNTGVNSPTLIGESKEGVILKADPDRALALLDFRKVAGAHIENITLDCSDTNSIDHIHFGMYFVDCDNVTIRNVEVRNCAYCSVMAYCSDPSQYLNSRFDVHKLSIFGTGRNSVGDNLHPMGCIFENMQHSYFSDIYVTGVCKYGFEFKDYCRANNIDGLDIYDCEEGLYFGGDHNDGVPLSGFYCTNMNVSNYVARKVSYPILGGYTTNINIINAIIFDTTIQVARFGNSRNNTIKACIAPDANTTDYLYIDTCMLIKMELIGRTTTFAGHWINCQGSCSSILLELFGALDTSATGKVVNPNSSIRTIDYVAMKKYNTTFTDASYS